MSQPRRGEVWLVDLGMAAKVRPCVVVSIPIEDSDRALATAIPHTTSVSFLKAGAFDAQGVVTVLTVRLLRRLGSLQPDQLSKIESSLASWLGLRK